jgi:hypothetical protein
MSSQPKVMVMVGAQGQVYLHQRSDRELVGHDVLFKG